MTTMKEENLKNPKFESFIIITESKESTSTNFENDEVTMNPRVAAVIINDYIARREDKISVAGLVIGLTFVAAFLSMVIGLLGE